MTAPKSPNPTASAPTQKTIPLGKLPPAIRRLLASVPEAEWPNVRAFLVESEVEGELVEMLPEINLVMKKCPQRLMGLVGKREIRVEELDRFYTKFHDSIHGVRQSLFELLELSGFHEDARALGVSRPMAAPALPGPGAVPAASQDPGLKPEGAPAAALPGARDPLAKAS